MKKLIAILIVFVLASSFALAQDDQKGIHEPGTGIEEPELKEEGQGTGQGQPELISAGEQEMTQQMEGEQIREQNKQMLQQGLENALQQVTNENAR